MFGFHTGWGSRMFLVIKISEVCKGIDDIDGSHRERIERIWYIFIIIPHIEFDNLY